MKDAISYQTRQFFPRRTRYCVAVITLNEGDRLRHQLARMQERAALADVVVVDGHSTDGSTDPSFLTAQGVAALINVDETGLGRATAVALKFADDQGYEGVITLDGNGKDGVEALPQFIQGLDDGFDLVQGSRFMKGGVHKNTPLDRWIGIRWIMAPLVGLTSGFWYTDPTNAFRALSMRFLRDARVQPIRRIFGGFNLQHYLIYRAAKLGFKVKEIPVSRVYPDDGSVPTKIVSWRLKFMDLWELVQTVMGQFNPN